MCKGCTKCSQVQPERLEIGCFKDEEDFAFLHAKCADTLLQDAIIKGEAGGL
jgi:hypothetical protein